MEPHPEYLTGDSGLVLRRWVIDDAPRLAQAVGDSVEHLRPWMPWAAQEPLALAERRLNIATWEHDWRAGGDLVMGVFVDGAVAGGCGLHHRIGPDGLEIGYWIHPAFLRQGIATAAARLLTNAAFHRPEITRVEIHHDKANLASAGVPRKLGFQLIGEMPDEPQAPGEVGISCEWQITRADWTLFAIASTAS
ncbi:GNAT family N-acetyltransferase [Conexibacter sp. S30A1]|uniref:GNAT family N-acetyltransferase n=1 Tax=Conexibacter sp. S30A1 TaxID=2937800 RepID=UPI002010B4CF|nr:GNAT family protein [Conexibacter sp. S30A1]